jgi:hypothetical protein
LDFHLQDLANAFHGVQIENDVVLPPQLTLLADDGLGAEGGLVLLLLLGRLLATTETS